MKDDSPTEAARRIVEWYPHMATPNEYDRDAYTVARAYLRAVEALEKIEEVLRLSNGCAGPKLPLTVFIHDVARAALTDGAEGTI